MSRWDNKCDDIVDEIKKLGVASRAAYERDDHVMSYVLDGKARAALSRLYDYLEVPGHRSMRDLIQELFATIKRLIGR
jgi:DNA polymerase III delta prime subunit